MSAPIHCACPKCQTRIAVPPHLAGTKGACPNCQQRLQFPGAPPINRTVLAPPIAPDIPTASFAPVPIHQALEPDDPLDFTSIQPKPRPRPQPQQHEAETSALSIAALVLALCSAALLLLPCLWLLAVPVALASVTLGIFGHRRDNSTVAVASIALGSIALVGGAIETIELYGNLSRLRQLLR